MLVSMFMCDGCCITRKRERETDVLFLQTLRGFSPLFVKRIKSPGILGMILELSLNTRRRINIQDCVISGKKLRELQPSLMIMMMIMVHVVVETSAAQTSSYKTCFAPSFMLHLGVGNQRLMFCSCCSFDSDSSEKRRRKRYP